MKILFIGHKQEDGVFGSIYENAVRISKEISDRFPKVAADVMLLPDGSWEDFDRTYWLEKMRSFDLVVVVKHTLWSSFSSYVQEFYDVASEADVVVISHPVDGDWEQDSDPFTRNIADHTLAVSQYQQDVLVSVRDASTVHFVGHAVRTAFEETVPIRDAVQTVLWENPVHHDPKFPGERKEAYDELESRIQNVCAEYGAELDCFISYGVPYKEWRNRLLSADITIECKALNKDHNKRHLQKPPTKMQNYLSLGMPAVCDSVPSYLNLGTPGDDFLVADNLEEWDRSLRSLFESTDRRQQLSRNGRNVVQKNSVQNVSQRYVSAFETIHGN